MTVAGSLPRSVTSLALVSWLVLSTRHDFVLIEWALSPIRQLLVTAKI